MLKSLRRELRMDLNPLLIFEWTHNNHDNKEISIYLYVLVAAILLFFVFKLLKNDLINN